MLGIWVEWKNGNVEKVDEAESESEALYLVQEYQVVFADSAKRVWPQL